MITVVASKGSVPRKPGARMLVLEDGTCKGTIGGGNLEWQAIGEAQRLLRQHQPAAHLSRIALGPGLGQCCGGSVQLLTEVFIARDSVAIGSLATAERTGGVVTEGEIHSTGVRRRIKSTNAAVNQSPAVRLDANRLQETFGADDRQLLLFGSGHVGRALVLALAQLPFEVQWFDSREDSFPKATPANIQTFHVEPPHLGLNMGRPGAFVLVMTHSHALDLEIVASALADTRFEYVGLIGSKTKRARFCKRMREAGMTSAAIDRLVCPIGVAGVTAKEPAAIAAAVACELLIYNEQTAIAQ